MKKMNTIKLNKFISRINWRLILLHLIAAWFFIEAFKELSYLHDLKWREVFTQKWLRESYDKSRLIAAIDYPYYFASLGLLVAFIISLGISIKQHWFWVNSLIVFIIGYLLYRLGFLGWNFFKYIFLQQGKLFPFDSAAHYLADCLPMLALGLIIFFSGFTNRFIKEGFKTKSQLEVVT